jgi:GxxExxY protein
MATSPVRLADLNHLTGRVIRSAMKVHSALGPGLLESAYQACLLHELRKQGVKVESEVVMPVVYDGVKIDLGYRMDMVVEDSVVVELKCVEAFSAVHEAQLLSYLKLSGIHVGLLINFHVAHLRYGIKRMVSGRNSGKIVPFLE